MILLGRGKVYFSLRAWSWVDSYVPVNGWTSTPQHSHYIGSTIWIPGVYRKLEAKLFEYESKVVGLRIVGGTMNIDKIYWMHVTQNE